MDAYIYLSIFDLHVKFTFFILPFYNRIKGILDFCAKHMFISVSGEFYSSLLTHVQFKCLGTHVFMFSLF